MTVPTQLTVLRIILTFVTLGFLFSPGWIAKALALACFAVASLTDWLDGYLARRWHQQSALGALLDPIADKVLVLGCFLAFIQLRVIPAWMVLIILLRELLITGVRLFAAGHHIVLSAEKEGKHKTVSQMVTIVVILCTLLLRAWAEPTGGLTASLNVALERTIMGCLWVTVILTVVSGAGFFWRHRNVLRDATSR